MVTFNLILQLIVSGLLLGAIYALIALGLSIIWGTSRIINIAHGSFIIIGAYVTYFMYHTFGVDPFLYLPFSGIMVGIIGAIIQYTLYNRLLGKDHLITLILAFGVSIVLSSLMIILFTPNFRFLSTQYTQQSYEFGSILVKKGELVSLFISIAVFGVTYFFLEKTNTGRAIRAVAQDREAALLMGINEERIYMIAMFISATVAGIAGGMVAILYTFTPDSGSSWLGWSFAISILAGLGTIQGVLIAGLIVGTTRSLTTIFAQGLEPSVGFMIMIIVMLFRSQGLFGRVSE